MTETNQFLVEATVGTGYQAERAFQAWKRDADFDRLDLAAYRLLPMLGMNLQSCGIDDPLLGRLGGIYKRVWLETNVMFEAMAPAIERLGRGTIVGEAALAIEGRLRPIRHATFCLPEHEIANAVSDLRSLGWKPRSFLKRSLNPTDVNTHVLRSGNHTIRLWNGTVRSELSALLDEPFVLRSSNRLVLAVDTHYLADRLRRPLDSLSL